MQKPAKTIRGCLDELDSVNAAIRQHQIAIFVLQQKQAEIQRALSDDCGLLDPAALRALMGDSARGIH